MKKNLRSLSIFLLLAISTLPAFSQWTQRQSLPAMSRTFATGFTVNNTIYVMGGFDGNQLFDDVWAYEPLTDTWIQKGNFPGGTRSASTAFSIGNKAYMGTGTNGNNYLQDFWEYEPVTDVWTQKANFPGFEREEAVGFSIGSKGYLGMGQTFVVLPNTSFTTTYNDFYEYDPSTDSWSQKDSLPGPSRAYAVSAVVNGIGYVGLGGNDDQTLSFTDFYAYDVLNDQWSQKASMGGAGRADAGIVAAGNSIYILGGINFPNFNGIATSRKYDVLTDTWSNAPNFSGGIIIAPIVQQVNGRVFAGTGYNSSFFPRNDWWEFTALTTDIPTIGEEPSMVFPNPFSSELKIQLEKYEGEFRIAIIDVCGKVVYEELSILTKSVTKRIDTQQISKGIYFLRIINSSGEMKASQKMIKN